ncbi:MAG: PAS domain S-box protein, partial [Elusimicrobiota bacterium]
CAGMGHDYCLPELRPAEDWGPEVEGLLADLSDVERIQPKSLLEREAGKARESEQKYRQLFDSAADMIFLRDPELGTLVDVNPRAALQLGYDREELLSRNYFDLLAGAEEVAETRRMFAQALEGGPATRVSVFRRKDGQSLEAEVRNTPMRVGDKTLILGIARDLTAQRLLERRALAFYQAFLNSNDFMFHTDRNGVIQDVNDAFVRRFGYSREEAIGRSPRLVRSRHSDQRLYEGLWRDIQDPSRGFWRGRIINRTKSGEEVPVLLSITTVRDARGEIVGFVSSAVDISEVEELHQRLTRSESLAAVGSMAAVVAHEIRNPLGSIVTAASSLTREDVSREERGTLLSVLRKESLRLSETLRHFLQYARPREPKLEKADLNETVREVLSMIKADPQVLGAIKVGERFDDGLSPFPFDADQLRQVIWNVVLNALQAMGGRGRLEVSTESPRSQEE